MSSKINCIPVSVEKDRNGNSIFLPIKYDGIKDGIKDTTKQKKYLMDLSIAGTLCVQCGSQIDDQQYIIDTIVKNYEIVNYELSQYELDYSIKLVMYDELEYLIKYFKDRGALYNEKVIQSVNHVRKELPPFKD